MDNIRDLAMNMSYVRDLAFKLFDEAMAIHHKRRKYISWDEWEDKLYEGVVRGISGSNGPDIRLFARCLRVYTRYITDDFYYRCKDSYIDLKTPSAMQELYDRMKMLRHTAYNFVQIVDEQIRLGIE